jgi:perosamine synthetase
MMIPHSRPSIEADDIRAAAQVLQSRQLAQGGLVEQFERRMAAYFGLSGGVAVTSGTAALEVALRALGIGPGDDVLLPSYVCAAPLMAIQRVGALPRLVDIELDTFNIDPAAARRTLTSKTKAVIVPHLFGLPANLTALEQLGVPIIEDCAQTIGATEQGRPVGSIGLLTVCSFYATKLLCTGEGGMVLSRDESLLERARRLRA